jgi:hypothetical protein
MTDAGIPARWADRPQDGRSAMARASDARPFKPYVYKGGGEDAYRGVTGYLEEVRRRIAYHEENAPDIGPSPEWYRERAAEDADDLRGLTPAATTPPVRVPPPAPPLSLALVPDDGELADLESARDRYHAAQDTLNAPPEPVPLAAPPPVTAATRCRACGYLTSAAGHRVMCDG